MAIRYREKRGHWEVYWRNPYTSRTESATFRDEAEAKKYNGWIKYKLEFDKEYFKPENKEEEKSDDNCLEVVDWFYLKEKKFNRNGFDWHLDAMAIPLQMIGRKPISEITTRDLALVLKAHQEKQTKYGQKGLGVKPVKGVTVRSRMKVFYTVLRWAKRRGFLERLPEFPELPAAHYKPILIPTQDELERLLEVASAHIQRIVILGSKTGIRVGPSELFKLRWEHFDFRRGVITVQAAKKNAQEPVREVPIREDLMELFQHWHEEDRLAGIPWVIHFHGKPVSHVRRAWAETLRKAGITRELTPYCLRHLFATEALAAQVDVGTVAKIMGHSSPMMVLKHYQHVMTRQKKEAVEALSGFSNLSALYGRPCMGKKNGPVMQ